MADCISSILYVVKSQLRSHWAKAVREEAAQAISDALDATADKTTATARKVAENAASGFLATAVEAKKAAITAAGAAQEAVREAGWLFLAAIFLGGVAVGAGGLYLAYTPTVYLDTAKIVQEVSAACRKR